MGCQSVAVIIYKHRAKHFFHRPQWHEAFADTRQTMSVSRQTMNVTRQSMNVNRQTMSLTLQTMAVTRQTMNECTIGLLLEMY